MNLGNTKQKIDENISDAELVGLILEDQELFLHIIERYKSKLFAYIRRISNLSEEEAEDVLQDVFIKVYQNLNDYDPSLKFSSWVYRITHNQVISNFRKLNARPQKYGLDLEDDIVKNIASDMDMASELDSKLLKQKITQVLDQMEIKYKQVLVLKFLEEKSYNEISDIIKKPIGTVGSMMNKAKKEFQKAISNMDIKI